MLVNIFGREILGPDARTIVEAWLEHPADLVAEANRAVMAQGLPAVSFGVDLEIDPFEVVLDHLAAHGIAEISTRRLPATHHEPCDFPPLPAPIERVYGRPIMPDVKIVRCGAAVVGGQVWKNAHQIFRVQVGHDLVWVHGHRGPDAWQIASIAALRDALEAGALSWRFVDFDSGGQLQVTEVLDSDPADLVAESVRDLGWMSARDKPKT